MTDRDDREHAGALPVSPARARLTARPAPQCDKMLCERCGTEMFRMHAVWRCPGCGFKTDCCGW